MQATRLPSQCRSSVLSCGTTADKAFLLPNPPGSRQQSWSALAQEFKSGPDASVSNPSFTGQDTDVDVADFGHHLDCLARMYEALLTEVRMAKSKTSCEALHTPASISETAPQAEFHDPCRTSTAGEPEGDEAMSLGHGQMHHQSESEATASSGANDHHDSDEYQSTSPEPNRSDDGAESPDTKGVGSGTHNHHSKHAGPISRLTAIDEQQPRLLLPNIPPIGFSAPPSSRKASEQHRLSVKPSRVSPQGYRESLGRAQVSFAAPANGRAIHHSMETWPEWKEHKQLHSWQAHHSASQEYDGLEVLHTLRDRNAGKVVKMLMIRPGSGKRLVWDLISCFWLLFDAAMLPFFSVFDIEPSTFFEVANWMLGLFWTFDIFLSFLTGYFAQGQLILRPLSVASRYIRTWFFPDIIIVVLDWTVRVLDYTANSEGTSSGLMRTMRIVRFGRAVRLIRLLKIARVLDALQDRINSESMSAVVDVLCYTSFLLGFSHIVACIWYAVGKAGTEDMHNGRSWLVAQNMAERSIAYQYFSSLHWTLSFFAASCEIFPISMRERAMTVVVLVLALVGFSSFLSVFTSAVLTTVNTRNARSRQYWMLRRYFRAKAISNLLALRVERYLNYIDNIVSHDIQDSDVELLARLSDTLRDELKAEAYQAHLTHHPFFFVLSSDIKHFVRACSLLYIGCKDELFCCGQLAEKMFIVSSGEMMYEKVADTGRLQSVRHEPNGPSHSGSMCPTNSGSMRPAFAPLGSGVEADCQAIYVNEWVAEAVLWMPWTHLGNLIAGKACQLVAIDSAIFREQISKKEAVWERTQRYASAFVRVANKLDPSELTDLVDRAIKHSNPELDIAIRDAEIVRKLKIMKRTKWVGKRDPLTALTNNFKQRQGFKRKIIDKFHRIC